MVNVVDVTKSQVERMDGGLITEVDGRLVFIDKVLDGLTIFKERTLLSELLCTQTFVDRVEAAGSRTPNSSSCGGATDLCSSRTPNQALQQTAGARPLSQTRSSLGPRRC